MVEHEVFSSMDSNRSSLMQLDVVDVVQHTLLVRFYLSIYYYCYYFLFVEVK